MSRRKSITTPTSKQLWPAGTSNTPKFDRESFKDLYEQHKSELQDLLHSEFGLVGDDCAEVMQDALANTLDAWSNNKLTVDPLESLVTFCRKAAHKLRNSRRRHISPVDPATLPAEHESTPFERDEDHDDGTAISDEGRVLREFIKSRQDPIERDILNAYFWRDGRGYAPEVAKKHGLRPGTVRNKLKKLLGDCENYLSENGCPVPASRDTEVIKKIVAIISGNPALAASPAKGGLTDQQADEIVAWSRKAPRSGGCVPASPCSVNPPRYIKTGLEPLDVLLGGRGFIQGSSILFRGRPGTGKTTLALQIAKHAIENGHAFVFASVEDQPAALLDRVTQSFWDQGHTAYLGDPRHWQLVDLSRYFDFDVRQQARNEMVEDLIRSSEMSETERATEAESHQFVDAIMDHPLVKRRTQSLLREIIHDMELDMLLERLWDGLAIKGTTPVILVVDSLNALINGATMRFRGGHARQAMLAVFNSFRRWRSRRREQVTVLFLVEHDARIEAAAASYLADVVIDLGRRTVEHTIYEKEGKASKWLQGMRFCRVRKGRGLPIQDRACAYEFVKDKRKEDGSEPPESGIVFLPTYGAQGVVSLFYENPAMRDVITTLREHDVPALFPQVLVQEFSRTALQRMFSVSRRRTSMSLRHPMMLSNIDEYWLKRLRYNKLIHPIPASRLRICRLSLEDSPEYGENSPFIKELSGKEEMFAGIKENGEKEYYGIPQIANVGMLVYRRDLLREIRAKPPGTWQQVEAICSRLRATRKLHYKIRLELTSYDTFLATALELGWAHGAFWRTRDAPNDKLKIEFERDSCVIYLIAALARLRHWIFSMEILPKGSSVDPEANPGQDWVFARHWYSTWINVSARKEVAEERRKGAEYGVLPIPLDAGYMKRSKGAARHHSAWGEWYLAILRGSENIDLGIELINNLMTARKITERARSGAALPTTERFYDITDEDCPETDLSFLQMRDQFFADAKSRSEFDNYPRFARIFSAVLRTVTTNPRADLIETVRKGLHNIDPEFNWPSDLERRLVKVLSPDLLQSLRTQ